MFHDCYSRRPFATDVRAAIVFNNKYGINLLLTNNKLTLQKITMQMNITTDYDANVSVANSTHLQNLI